MKYIAYITVEMLPGNTVKLIYNSIPSSFAALRELKRIGDEILGINLTDEQCKMRALQHSLAIDARQYVN